MNATESGTQVAKTDKHWVQTWAEKSLFDALPKYIDKQRFIRVAIVEMNRNPTLLECTRESLAMSLMDAGRMGLEIGGLTGEAYLIPRRLKGTMTCQLQVGYKGLTKLARNSGEIKTIAAAVVYEGEPFEIEYGMNPRVKHDPTVDVPRSRETVRLAWCMVATKDGGVFIDVVRKDEIEKRRKVGASGRGISTPWDAWYEEMARKTAIIKLMKGGTVPLSAEAQQFVDYDNQNQVAMVEMARAARSLPAAASSFVPALEAKPDLDGDVIDAQPEVVAPEVEE